VAPPGGAVAVTVGLIVGCDPGLTGAFAVIDREAALIHVEDMPTRTKRVNGTDRAVIDEDGVRDFLLGQHMLGAKQFVIERVAGLPGQSASRAFVFGYGFGVVLSAARMIGYDVDLVTPQQWKGQLVKRAMRDKSASIKAATARFGDEHWRLKKHHGRAEASLIALYGLRHLWGDA
jgi:hypothetical protein